MPLFPVLCAVALIAIVLLTVRKRQTSPGSQRGKPTTLPAGPCRPKSSGVDSRPSITDDIEFINMAARHQIPLDIDVMRGNGTACLADMVPLGWDGDLLRCKKRGKIQTIPTSSIVLALLAPMPDPAKRPASLDAFFKDLLRCPSPKRRAGALYQLELLERSTALGLAMERAADPDAKVRKAVGEVLPRFFRQVKRQVMGTPHSLLEPEPEPVVLETLEALTRDPDPDVSRAARESLEGFTAAQKRKAVYEAALAEKKERPKKGKKDTP